MILFNDTQNSVKILKVNRILKKITSFISYSFKFKCFLLDFFTIKFRFLLEFPFIHRFYDVIGFALSEDFNLIARLTGPH